VKFLEAWPFDPSTRDVSLGLLIAGKFNGSGTRSGGTTVWAVLHRAVSGFDHLSALHAVPFQTLPMENLPVEILSKIIDCE
jgi:hypothetical protein